MLKFSRVAPVVVIGLASLIPSAGAFASSPPPIQQIKPLSVKWILPPRGSEFYWADRAFALSMGYEVVENDDLTYPGPRLP